MKETNKISASVVCRLPRYYRFLCELLNGGTERISSRELAQKMGLTASQIRQDFNCYGGFGQQGYGYNVAQLKTEMADILGIYNTKNAILIGAGNLGKAVANQLAFDNLGFRLVAIFDCDPKFEGVTIRDIPVWNNDMIIEYCVKNTPDMAILCLPAHEAPKIVDQLVLLGIRSFWNFSHYDIHQKYPLANVENVHLSDSLMKLSYIIKNSKD